MSLFFTTKGAGKGTGLGLATIYSIISQNKGTIWVYSEINKGTTFKIYLPLVTSSVTQQTYAHIKTKIKRKSAHVLVIDDELELKSLIAEVLKANGYEVQVAANGVEGLKLIESSSKPFDLVISDVMMPQMTGAELKEEIEIRGLETKILFISGYAEGTVFEEQDINPIHFLEKPFTTVALLEKIDHLLK